MFFYIKDGILQRSETFPAGHAQLLFSEDAVPSKLSVPEGVREIAPFTFKFCPELQEISLPESFLRIGRSAFDGCTSLETVGIPAAETIGSGAFHACICLRSVTLPEKTTAPLIL